MQRNYESTCLSICIQRVCVLFFICFILLVVLVGQGECGCDINDIRDVIQVHKSECFCVSVCNMKYKFPSYVTMQCIYIIIYPPNHQLEVAIHGNFLATARLQT